MVLSNGDLMGYNGGSPSNIQAQYVFNVVEPCETGICIYLNISKYVAAIYWW